MDVVTSPLNQAECQANKLAQTLEQNAKPLFQKKRRLSIKIFDSAETLAQQAALSFWATLTQSSSIKTILATGETPRKMYRNILQLNQLHPQNFSQHQFYHLDEFYDFETDRYSFSQDLWDNFIQELGVPQSQYFSWLKLQREKKSLHSIHEDFCLNPADIAILGIGRNGHIGFNEPGSALYSIPRIVKLRKITQELFADTFRGDPPKHAVTLGIATILKTKKILLIATGSHKARAIADMFAGEISAESPASFLQLHTNVQVYLDNEAASLLNHDENTDEPSVKVIDRIREPILFCSPHPDDTAISAGGLLAANHSKASNINFYSGHRAKILGTNEWERIAIRAQEAMLEAEILGIESFFAQFEGYNHNYEPNSADIIRLGQFIDELKPRHLFTALPFDHHPAHRGATALLMRTLEQLQPSHCLDIWFYETPWTLFQPGEMNRYFFFDEKWMNRKVAAILAHLSQVTRTPYEDSAISLARFRSIVGREQDLSTFGSNSLNSKMLNKPYAECFWQIRAYIDRTWE